MTISNSFFKLNSIINEIQNNPKENKLDSDALSALEKTILHELKSDPEHVNLADAYTFTLHAKNSTKLAKISAKILNSPLQAKFDAAKNIPPEFRGKFLELITMLAKTEKMSAYTIETIVEGISADHIDALIQLKIAHPWIKGMHLEELSKALLSLPEDKKNSFIEIAKLLSSDNPLRAYHLEELAEIFVNLPSEQVENFTQFFLKTKTAKGINFEEIKGFAEGLQNIPLEEVEHVFTFTSNLYIPNFRPKRGLETIVVFFSTPLARILIDPILKFQANIPLKDFGEVVKAFIEIGDRSSLEDFEHSVNAFNEKAIPLFTAQMNTRDRIAILKNLKFAELLVECGVNLSKKSGLATLSKLMEKNGNIKEVIKEAQSFITKDMNLYDIEDVYNILAETSKETVENAKKTFDSRMSWHDKAAVMLIFNNMPLHVQENAIQEFKKQNPESLNWTQKIALLLNAKVIHEKPQPKIKEVMVDESFEFPYMEMPKESSFQDTDLIIFKNDFKGSLPRNGITESEFKKIEEILHQIKSNQSKIKIIRNDDHFPCHMEECFKMLLTRATGRKLLTQILEHKNLTELPIFEGDSCSQMPGFGIQMNLESEHVMKKFEHLPLGDIQIRKESPLFLTLGHEMFHFLHDLDEVNCEKLAPTMGVAYHDLEEQRTITGFGKEPDLNLETPNLEMDAMEDWENAQLDEPWDFDLLNERNLTAAFTDSSNVFHPRFSHRGEEVPYPGIKALIKVELAERFKKLALSPNEVNTLVQML